MAPARAARVQERFGGALVMALVTLSSALSATPVLALGPEAPPVVTFRAAWVNTASTDAFVRPDESEPQLYASINVLISGGDVPRNVQSVTVTLPDGVTQVDIPKLGGDLEFEQQYFRNLTQAGVVGFPPGTYTFTVTDTANGVTTLTDTLAAPSALAPTTSIVVSGAVQVSSAPAELFSLNYATDPTPTVSWAPVTGAARYILVIQSLANNIVYQHTIVGPETSSTLPAGVMVPGRIYRVLVRAEDSANGLPQTESRSEGEIRVILPGPDLSLSVSPVPAQAGQEVRFSARLVNTGPPLVVNARAWLGRPDGTVEEVASLEALPIPTSTDQPSNNFFNAVFAARLFTDADPSGNYLLGGRLTDPATGETIAQASVRFQK
jgi:hypothetical protein